MITAGGKQRIYVTVAGMIIFSILNLLNKFSNKKSPANVQNHKIFFII